LETFLDELQKLKIQNEWLKQQCENEEEEDTEEFFPVDTYELYQLDRKLDPIFSLYGCRRWLLILEEKKFTDQMVAVEEKHKIEDIAKNQKWERYGGVHHMHIIQRTRAISSIPSLVP
jgi:hypothetical protein